MIMKRNYEISSYNMSIELQRLDDSLMLTYIVSFGSKFETEEQLDILKE